MRGAGYDEDDARILTDHVLDAALCGYEYSGLPKLLNVVDYPLFKNPRSLQLAAAVEQTISKRVVMVISYTQNETWRLQHRLNTNLFRPYIDGPTLYPIFPTVNPITGIPCTDDGTPIPCHPNATIAGFHQNFSTGHSTYRGMSAQIKGQPTRNLRMIANFT